MPKRKDLDQEPATKSDLKILKGDLDQKFAGIDQKFAGIDQKFVSSDQKFNNLVLKVVQLEMDVKEIKENMMTKEDKNEILNVLDKLAGEFKSFEKSVLIHGNWLEDHDKKLKNHEGRLVKLESSV